MAIEFNKEFYLQSKFNQLEAEGLLEEFGLTSVEELATYFAENGVDAEEHYLNYGMSEGINPSAEFNTKAYLEDKLAELQDVEKYGDTYADYTVQDVIAEFQGAGLTPLAHFNAYGADEGLEATPVDGDAGAPSELTEALEQYETAVEARDTAFDDFVEAAEGAPAAFEISDYADGVAPADYIADSIEEAEDALARVEATLTGSRAATADAIDAGARAVTSAGADTTLSAGNIQALAAVTVTVTTGSAAVFFNNDLLKTGDRFSDARLDAIVAEAQTALNEDDRNYNEDGEVIFQASDSGTVSASQAAGTAAIIYEEGDFLTGVYSASGEVSLATTDVEAYDESDVFTARQLQSKLNAANSDLTGDINRKGTNFEIGAQLNSAIASYLANNTNPALEGVRADFVAWSNAVANNPALANAQNFEDIANSVDWEAKVDTAIDAIFSADTSTTRADIEAADAASGIPSSIVNLLLDLNSRFEKQEAVTDREDALLATESGFDFLQAVELQEDRAEQVEARDNASELVDTLTGLQGDYETAVSDASDAAEALGYDVVEVEDGIIFGEADTDELFIFNTENLEELGFTSVTLEELEAGDALFFGTAFQAGSDIEAGDNNVQEIFVTSNNAGDVVLEVENSVFGSAQDDTLAVTLTGISEDQISIDAGVVSIA